MCLQILHLAGAGCGLIHFLLHLPQLCYGELVTLGLCGLLSRKKHGLPLGYLVGVLGRFVFAVLSGVLFFAAYAPEGMPVLLYSVAYNGSYLGLEAAITLVILLLPPVGAAMDHVKTLARRTPA